MEGEVADIVKYPALGLFGPACKTMMRTPALSPICKELLIKEIDNELEELCKKKNNSILRQTKAEELVDFQMAKFIQEIKEKTPLLNQTLQSICSSNNKKRAPDALVDPNVKATITATILHQRCPEMSALAYRTGLVLRHASAGGLVCSDYAIYYRWNKCICCLIDHLHYRVIDNLYHLVQNTSLVIESLLKLINFQKQFMAMITF